MAPTQNVMSWYNKTIASGEKKIGRWADCEDSDDESVTTQAFTGSEDSESLCPDSESGVPGREDGPPGVFASPAPLNMSDAELQRLLDFHQQANEDSEQQMRELEQGLLAKKELFQDLSQRNSESRRTMDELSSLSSLLQAAPTQSFVQEPLLAKAQDPLIEVEGTWSQLQQAKQRQEQLASENALLQDTLERLLSDKVDADLIAQAEALLGGAAPGAPFQQPPTPVARAEPAVATVVQTLETLSQAELRKSELLEENAALERMLQALAGDVPVEAAQSQPVGLFQAPEHRYSAELFRRARALREPLVALEEEVLPAARLAARFGGRSWELCD